MSQKEVIRLKQVSTLFEIEAVFLAPDGATEKQGIL